MVSGVDCGIANFGDLWVLLICCGLSSGFGLFVRGWHGRFVGFLVSFGLVWFIVLQGFGVLLFLLLCSVWCECDLCDLGLCWLFVFHVRGV